VLLLGANRTENTVSLLLLLVFVFTKLLPGNELIKSVKIFSQNVGVPIKQVMLVKMRLNETCNKVLIGKYLFDNFPIQNGLKQGDALSPLFFNFTLEYAMRKI
jgi:hypothetical protein